MFFSDADFLERNGLVNLDLEKKMILLSYILKKLFKFEFLLIIFFSVLLLTFVNYKKKLINYKKLNIFFIIFYISILSPFIFLMISPKIFSHFYLFNNIIVISAFLLFFFSILSIMKFYAIKIVPIKIISNTAFVIILLTLFTNFYQNQKNYNEIQLTSDSISKRNEFKKNYKSYS